LPQNTSAELDSMMNRLEEIKEIDKSSLSSSEKKELRKEVRDIKRKTVGNGIYLSTGAAIIIVLLLIILL
jgi:Mor family transcriptional regulator